MARRGENIYKRKDGRWEGRYVKRRRPDRSIHYGYVYAYSYKDVRKKLIEKKYQYRSVRLTPSAYQGTVGQWVTGWLTGDVKQTVKTSTYASYRYKLTHYLLPLIGEYALESIDQALLQQVIQTLATRGLSSTTIQLVLQIFRSALQEAIAQHYVSNTLFDSLVYPKQIKPRVTALSRRDQKQLEQAAHQTPEGVAVLVALHTGLRIGEISALTWTDIDFSKKELVVSRTLQRVPSPTRLNQTEILEGAAKSPSAHRVIPLNQTMMQLLRQQKQQATSPYVVGRNGRYAEPRTLTNRFRKLVGRLRLPTLHFHQLRHTFATRLLEKGADIASVSALLGHHSAKLTLDVYVDSLMTQRKKWVNQLG